MTGPERPTVSVVIPTIGRPQLADAVASVFAQTYPVDQVVVVVDADVEISLPDDPRIHVVHTEFGTGSSAARQTGIECAKGDVIALLDDDDEWFPDKLAIQLDSVADVESDLWLSSTLVEVHDGRPVPRVMPTRVIEPHERVDDYLFRFHEPRFGGSGLQTSTLCFPRAVADRVPWARPTAALHDDPTWVMQVRDAFPDIAILQIPTPLVRYNMEMSSLSRTGRDESRDYIAWGDAHLCDADRRTKGDYYFTGPVTSAVSGTSLIGVLRAMAVGVRKGTPGPWAVFYAVASIARVLLKKMRSMLPSGANG
ncbi:glycosyl transferase [Rhodococcoides trifolii]|uniref:Glycosyl transferase n=1 Tax=Rhodococcoides trifolii TaxID=908250 RepID=A0A917G8S8_9NOCA|nr:glycosyltransferase family 2 protein [Rhodococcus trifolii]GGG27946.1 glycosyl transferase [Rhodococcus trifolii]